MESPDYEAEPVKGRLVSQDFVPGAQTQWMAGSRHSVSAATYSEAEWYKAQKEIHKLSCVRKEEESGKNFQFMKTLGEADARTLTALALAPDRAPSLALASSCDQ